MEEEAAPFQHPMGCESTLTRVQVRRGKLDDALKSIRRLGSKEESEDDFQGKLAYMVHTTNVERAETGGASFLECFKGTNWRRTEINIVIWSAQILSGNAILGYSVVFLEAAGFSEVQAFDINISLSVCYLVGGVVSWFRELDSSPHLILKLTLKVMARLGRATIYMAGLAGMLMCLFVIGGPGCISNPSNGVSIAIGVLMIIQTVSCFSSMALSNLNTAVEHVWCWPRLLPHRRRDSQWSPQVQDHRHRSYCVQRGGNYQQQ